MDGFKKFLVQGNLVELAVAVVIGAAFSDLIKAFTSGIIDPMLALFGGKPNLDSLKFTIRNTVFPYGSFLTALISFLITAAIIYFFIVKPLFHALKRMGIEKAEKDCPECASAIPRKATRCKFCTAQLSDVTIMKNA